MMIDLLFIHVSTSRCLFQQKAGVDTLQTHQRTLRGSTIATHCAYCLLTAIIVSGQMYNYFRASFVLQNT